MTCVPMVVTECMLYQFPEGAENLDVGHCLPVFVSF
jgi:hypothetical protein